MPLDDYRRKRTLAETTEPEGRARQSRRGRILSFNNAMLAACIMTFRLAINGVLLSWAMPKGPSIDPVELAIRTEDHPLEYAELEGVIPVGQYGAGTVMVRHIRPAKQHPTVRGAASHRFEPESVWSISAKRSTASSRTATSMLIHHGTLKGPTAIARSHRPSPERDRACSRTSSDGCLLILTAPAAGSALIARILMVVRADVSWLHIGF
jgi:hypothetical protein